MSEAKYRITLDVQDERSRERIVVRRGDDRRKVYITLVDGGKPFDLYDVQLVTFTGKRPDGNTAYGEPAVDIDKIVLVLGSQVTEVVGRVSGELNIYGEDGSLLFTPRFDIIVDETVYYEGDEILTPLSKTRVLMSPPDAHVGQYLEVEEVDDSGRVLKLKAVDAPEGTSSGAGLVIAARNGETMDVDLSKYAVDNESTIWFEPGQYRVAPFDLKDQHHVTFFLGSAEIVCQGEYFLKATGCDHLRIEGGKIEGSDDSRLAVELNGSKMFRGVRMHIANIGREHSVGAKGIQMTGDCSGFLLEQCEIADVQSGQVSDPDTDDWIHAYGVLINRSQSTESYSRSGVIRNCAFRRIAGIDQVGEDGAVTKKADGDGIYIQQYPYLDDSGALRRTDPNILIEDCSFEDCKKRGVKANSRGVTVRRCRFEGEFWFAPLEFQQGYGLVEDCRIINRSGYDGGTVAGIVLDDGGVTVRDSYISCAHDGGYFNGIVLDGRNWANPFDADASVPWDVISLERCTFDGVDWALLAGKGSGDGATIGYRLLGVHVIDCRFGLFTAKHAVQISQGRFGSIDSLRMVDYRFEFGTDRDTVRAKVKELTGTDSTFTYPIQYAMIPTLRLHIRSGHYLGAPTVTIGDSLPTAGSAPDTRIVYLKQGSIQYAERTSVGTRYYGSYDPGDADTDPSSMTLGMLKGSRRGDLYTFTGSGALYLCTANGKEATDSEAAYPGKWVKVATLADIPEVTA